MYQAYKKKSGATSFALGIAWIVLGLFHLYFYSIFSGESQFQFLMRFFNYVLLGQLGFFGAWRYYKTDIVSRRWNKYWRRDLALELAVIAPLILMLIVGWTLDIKTLLA